MPPISDQPWRINYRLRVLTEGTDPWLDAIGFITRVILTQHKALIRRLRDLNGNSVPKDDPTFHVALIFEIGSPETIAINWMKPSNSDVEQCSPFIKSVQITLHELT